VRGPLALRQGDGCPPAPPTEELRQERNSSGRLVAPRACGGSLDLCIAVGACGAKEVREGHLKSYVLDMTF
jgi:hypothetical protein